MRAVKKKTNKQKDFIVHFPFNSITKHSISEAASYTGSVYSIYIPDNDTCLRVLRLWTAYYLTNLLSFVPEIIIIIIIITICKSTAISTVQFNKIRHMIVVFVRPVICLCCKSTTIETAEISWLLGMYITEDIAWTLNVILQPKNTGATPYSPLNKSSIHSTRS